MDNTSDSIVTADPNDKPNSQFVEGQFIGEHGNYRLEKMLGGGETGEVWLATEFRGGLERKVVCKTLRADLQELDEAQKKALESILKLHHTNVCPIYAIEKDPACGYLIVMGYAEGGSFVTWFQEQKTQKEQKERKNGIRLNMVCCLLRPIADALDYVRSRNREIHLDVMPQNMMLTSDGTPWLIGFGIDSFLRSESTAAKGKFSDQYMAPEEKDGKPQTAKTDEYSLALVALEFLTGTTYVQATQSLSSEVRPVLDRALDLDSSKRFANCREFIDALSSSMKKSSRKWIVRALVFILFLAIILLFAGLQSN